MVPGIGFSLNLQVKTGEEKQRISHHCIWDYICCILIDLNCKTDTVLNIYFVSMLNFTVRSYILNPYSKQAKSTNWGLSLMYRGSSPQPAQL